MEMLNNLFRRNRWKKFVSQDYKSVIPFMKMIHDKICRPHFWLIVHRIVLISPFVKNWYGLNSSSADIYTFLLQLSE